MAKYLGVDYGSARVGVAVASEARLARPLTTVEPQGLVKVIQQEQPEVIVVGLPRNLDGDDTAQTREVRDFVARTIEPLGLTFVWQDEAGTTGVARERLQERGAPFVRSDVDAEAASIILQDYLGTL